MLDDERADVLGSELPEVLAVELRGAAGFAAPPGRHRRGALNGAAPAEACALEGVSAAEPRGGARGVAPAMPCRGALDGAAPTVPDGCGFAGSRGLEPRDVDVWLPLPDAQGSVSLAGLAKLPAVGEGAASTPVELHLHPV